MTRGTRRCGDPSTSAAISAVLWASSSRSSSARRWTSSSSAISANDTGGTSSTSRLSSSAYGSGSRSEREESSCPSLMYVVPSSSSASRNSRALLPHQSTLNRASQLAHRHRAFELLLDPSVRADEEHPRLGLEVPLPHPAVVAPRRVVVLVHLDVDEADVAALQAATHVRHDVHDRPAGPARAERGRREDDDERQVR